MAGQPPGKRAIQVLAEETSRQLAEKERAPLPPCIFLVSDDACLPSSFGNC